MGFLLFLVWYSAVLRWRGADRSHWEFPVRPVQFPVGVTTGIGTQRFARVAVFAGAESAANGKIERIPGSTGKTGNLATRSEPDIFYPATTFIARFGLVLTTGVTFWFFGHHHGREQKFPTESPRRWY